MDLLLRAAGWAIGALLIATGVSAEGARLPDRPIETRSIPRLDAAGIQVDGRLDEPAWSGALEIGLGFENKPGEGIAPPVSTRVLLVHDESRLYIAFLASDPDPAAIRAHLMDRDRQETFEQDDYVAVLLDTYNDSRRAFEFRVNPRGVQMDGLYSQIGVERDFFWDVIWESAGQIGDAGWLVELAIPFDQLRFLATEGPQVWGIGLSRSWPREVLHQIEAHPVDRDDTCVLCQLPRFSGFAGIRPGHHLELTPTLTFEHTESAPFPGADLTGGGDEVEAGASLRWGVTPNLTLNATWNPDFSQVEADALQLSVNQRFALFFPEKRSFFLEGADFFDTQIDAVFTRTVIDPSWGLKLTGKPAGKSALGLFVVEDELNQVSLPSIDGTSFEVLPGKVRSLVARFRQDVGRSSSLGALYARRDGQGGYQNAVGGIDALLRLADSHVFQVQALASETTYPSGLAESFRQQGESLSGGAVEAIYQYQSRNWLGSVGWRSYDEDFRIDTGFVPRVDFQTWRCAAGRTFWSEEAGAFLNKADLNLVWLHTRDQEGRLTDDKLDFIATFELPLQSKLTLESIRRDERSGPVLFEELFSNRVAFEIQPNHALKAGAEISFGDAIDYANQRPAQERILMTRVELKPGIHWNAQLATFDQRLEAASGPVVASRFADLQLTYQMNTRSFVRGILQYVDIDFREANDPAGQDDRETLASQLLYSYKINPQTLLFVGWSDGRVTLEDGRLEPERRTFFVKLSYALSR